MTAMTLSRPRWRRFAPLALFALLAVLLGIGLTLKPREVPSPFIGKPAPAFSLPLLSDATKSFGPASMRGRVWLLNVWASWCAPCREEHPLLVAMAREEKVAIVGLNYKDDTRNAQEWLLRLGDPYLMTAVDHDGRAGIDWGVYGVPETFAAATEWANDAIGDDRVHWLRRLPAERRLRADDGTVSLALDFDAIDQAIATGAPQKYSWLLAHGLIVTLVWLYLEILRLLAKLQDRKR